MKNECGHNCTRSTNLVTKIYLIVRINNCWLQKIQYVSSSFVEESCAVMKITTPQHHYSSQNSFYSAHAPSTNSKHRGNYVFAQKKSCSIIQINQDAERGLV